MLPKILLSWNFLAKKWKPKYFVKFYTNNHLESLLNSSKGIDHDKRWRVTETIAWRIGRSIRWTIMYRLVCKHRRTFWQTTTITTNKKLRNLHTTTRTFASIYNHIISKYKLPTSISYRGTIWASSSSKHNIPSIFNINTMPPGSTTWWIWTSFQIFR